jgi:hypothetical protein
LPRRLADARVNSMVDVHREAGGALPGWIMRTNEHGGRPPLA